MGFEPMTSSLPRKCSTPELRRLLFSSQLSVLSLQLLTASCAPPTANCYRAEDEVRTRDL